ncbi:MAG: DNA recombination protein RmuC [Halieaceae bacterium]|jgi:DNA recombination protein RmuC|nr:DNA recombination protein RmuC [Halieaceae bacterium]
MQLPVWLPEYGWLVGAGAGLTAGAIGVWVSRRTSRRALDESERRRAEAERALTNSESSLRSLEAEHHKLATRLEERSDAQARSEQALLSQIASLRAELAERSAERDQIRDSLTAERTARLADQEKLSAQQQLLKEAREELSQQFRDLAGRIFEEKSQAFKSSNRESLEQLLDPLRTQIRHFETTVNEQSRQGTEKLGELKQQLAHMQSMSQRLQEEAHNLATALKGEKKKQGNWGELILDRVLDQSGLRAGIDYVRERSFNTEEGRRRPDVIVNLPDNKHLVIDAKVSLNDYTTFVNADDDDVRESALRAHRKAIANRIDELSQKNYFDLDGIRSPEIVFMFVPVESAFAEAFRSEPDLFQSAINKNVLVTTPTTLLTSLNIVSQLWRFEEQNKNALLLADRAKKIAEKFKTFTDAMLKLGNQIGTVNKTYDSAMRTLTHGKGNLVKQVHEFRDLGVPVLENKTKLDDSLVDTALAEIESGSPEDDGHEQREGED